MDAPTLIALAKGDPSHCTIEKFAATAEALNKTFAVDATPDFATESTELPPTKPVVYDAYLPGTEPPAVESPPPAELTALQVLVLYGRHSSLHEVLAAAAAADPAVEPNLDVVVPSTGDTLLHLAAKNHRDPIGMINALTELGANVEVTNRFNQTAVHTAAWSAAFEAGYKNSAAVIAALLEAIPAVAGPAAETPAADTSTGGGDAAGGDGEGEGEDALNRTQTRSPELRFASVVTTTVAANLLASSAATTQLLDTVDLAGNTAAHIAAATDAGTDFLSALLDEGASPTIPNKVGNLPSHVAALAGSTAAAELLASAAPEAFTVANSAGDSVFALACEANQAAAVATAIKGVVVVDPATRRGITDEWGSTAVDDIIAWPLRAALQNQSSPGITVLMRAAAAGNLDCVKAVLRFSDPRDVDGDGATALHYAARVPDPSVAAFLAADDPRLLRCLDCRGWPALFVAVEAGHTAVVEALFAAPGSFTPFFRDRKENTALHVAAAAGHSDVLRFLLSRCRPLAKLSKDRDADEVYGIAEYETAGAANTYPGLDARNADGDTALHLAVVHCPDTVVDFMGKRARIDVRNNERNTPLHLALAQRDSECPAAAMLSMAQTYQLPRNSSGDSALDLACRNDAVDALQIMLDSAAAKTACLTRNSEKETPLMILSESAKDTPAALVVQLARLAPDMTMKQAVQKSCAEALAEHQATEKQKKAEAAAAAAAESGAAVGGAGSTAQSVSAASVPRKPSGSRYSYASKRVAHGDVLAVRHEHVFARDRDGNTVFHRAARNGRVDVFMGLLDVVSPGVAASNSLAASEEGGAAAETALKAFNLAGDTPLMVAARAGRTALVNALVHLMANELEAVSVEQIKTNVGGPFRTEGWLANTKRETLLHAAGEGGCVALIDALLSEDGGLWWRPGPSTSGSSAAAAGDNSVRLAAALEVRTSEDSGQLAVHAAITAGKVDAANRLLDLHAQYSPLSEVDADKAMEAAVKADAAPLVRRLTEDFVQFQSDSYPYFVKAFEAKKWKVVREMLRLRDVYSYPSNTYSTAAFEPTARDRYGRTVLHDLAEDSSEDALEVVRAMASSYPSMFSITLPTSQETPLILACKAGNEEFCDVCVIPYDYYADDDGNTALHHAASRGLVRAVKRILERDTQDLNRRNHSGRTPLIAAVAERNVVTTTESEEERRMRRKLERSEGVPKVAPFEPTTTYPGLEAANVLLEWGAVRTARENCNHTSFVWYVCQNYGDAAAFPPKVIEAVESACSDMRSNAELTPLHALLLNHDEPSAELLDALLHGLTADALNARTSVSRPPADCPGGETALHIAARKGMTAVVSRLLACKRMEPNLRDANDKTPLHVAAACGAEPAGLLLLAADAVITSWSTSGETPLMAAAASSCSILAQGLVAAANELPSAETAEYLNSASHEAGRTALMLAAKSGLDTVVRELIAHGADLRTTTYSNESALHAACRGGQDAVAASLADYIEEAAAASEENGSKSGKAAAAELRKLLHAPGKDLETPLHLCARYGLARTARRLVKQNCPLNERDAQSNFPLHTALLNGSLDVALLLIAAVREAAAENSSLSSNPLLAPGANLKAPITFAAGSGLLPAFLVLLAESKDVAMASKERFAVEGFLEFVSGLAPAAAGGGHFAVVDAIFSYLASCAGPNTDYVRKVNVWGEMFVAVADRPEYMISLVERLERVAKSSGGPVSGSGSGTEIGPQGPPPKGSSGSSSASAFVEAVLCASTVTTMVGTFVHAALTDGHIDVALAMLQLAPSVVKKVDERHDTVLSRAAGLKCYPVVQYILEKAPESVKAVLAAHQNDSRSSTLHCALRANGDRPASYEIAAAVVNGFSTIASAVDAAGQSPLHLAVSAGFLDLVPSLLLTEGVDAVDKSRRTALNLATDIHRVDREMILCLMRGGVSVRVPEAAVSPLFAIAEKGDGELVRTFLQLAEAEGDARRAREEEERAAAAAAEAEVADSQSGGDGFGAGVGGGDGGEDSEDSEEGEAVTAATAENSAASQLEGIYDGALYEGDSNGRLPFEAALAANNDDTAGTLLLFEEAALSRIHSAAMADYEVASEEYLAAKQAREKAARAQAARRAEAEADGAAPVQPPAQSPDAPAVAASGPPLPPPIRPEPSVLRQLANIDALMSRVLYATKPDLCTVLLLFNRAEFRAKATDIQRHPIPKACWRYPIPTLILALVDRVCDKDLPSIFGGLISTNNDAPVPLEIVVAYHARLRKSWSATALLGHVGRVIRKDEYAAEYMLKQSLQVPLQGATSMRRPTLQTHGPMLKSAVASNRWGIVTHILALAPTLDEIDVMRREHAATKKRATRFSAPASRESFIQRISSTGGTLHYACSNRAEAMVSLLSGYASAKYLFNKNDPLVAAVQENLPRAVSSLLARSEVKVLPLPGDGSALHAAANGYHLGPILGRVVARAAADYNNAAELAECLDRSRQTAIMVAAVRSTPEALDMLLQQYGSAAAARNDAKRTALILAIQSRRPDTAYQIIAHASSYDYARAGASTAAGVDNALIEAVNKGYVRIVRRLGESSFSVATEVTEAGKSALHIAAEKGHFESVRALQDSYYYTEFKDLRLTGEAKSSALHLAVQKGYYDIVESLARTVTIDADANGFTPLHMAVDKKDVAMVKALVGLGGKPDSKGSGVKPPPPPLSLGIKNGLSQDAILAMVPEGTVLRDSFAKEQASCLVDAAKARMTEVVIRLLDLGFGRSDLVNFIVDVASCGHEESTLAVMDPLYPKSAYNWEPRRSEYANLEQIKDELLAALATTGADRSLRFIIRHLSSDRFDPDGGELPVPPLLSAIEARHTHTALALINAGASVLKGRVLDSNTAGGGTEEDTPMQLAASAGLQAVVRAILLKFQALVENEPEKRAEIGPQVFDAFVASCKDSDSIDLIMTFLLLQAVHLDDSKDSGATPLHHAAEQGHLVVTNTLLELDINVAAKDNDGMTALMIACAKGARDIAIAILDHHSTDSELINTKSTKDERAAIHYACVSDKPAAMLDVVSRLIASGASITEPDSSKHQPLHLACQHGAEDIALSIAKVLDARQMLGDVLRTQATATDADSDADRTATNLPLHYACERGMTRFVQLVIDKGFLGELTGSKEALSLAVSRGEGDLAMLLLMARGADVAAASEAAAATSTGDDAPTPASDGAFADTADVAALPADLLHTALRKFAEKSESRFGRVVDRLIADMRGDKAALNSKVDGQTALVLACSLKLSYAATLIHAGADVLAVDGRNKNALHYSADNGLAEVADLLMARMSEADIVAVDSDKRTALHFACMVRESDSPVPAKLSIANKILSRLKGTEYAKTVIAEPDDYSKTTLHYLCEAKATSDSVRVALQLLRTINSRRATAELLKRKTEGMTPLMKAYSVVANDASSPLLNALIPYGGSSALDVGDDDYNRTLLHTAAQKLDKDLVALLLANKASVTQADSYSDYPIHRLFSSEKSQGRAAIFYSLLKHNPSTLQQAKQLKHPGSGQNTVLHLACRDGDAEIASLISEALTTPASEFTNLANKANGDNYRPLHLALQYAPKSEGVAVALVELLVDAGVSLYIEDSSRVPLHMAIANSTAGSKTLVSTLLNYIEALGDAAMVTQLLNQTNSDGQTPLIHACAIGRADLADLLLKRVRLGVDVKARDTTQRDAFYYACSKGLLSVVTTFLSDHSEDDELADDRDELSDKTIRSRPTSGRRSSLDADADGGAAAGSSSGSGSGKKSTKSKSGSGSGSKSGKSGSGSKSGAKSGSDAADGEGASDATAAAAALDDSVWGIDVNAAVSDGSRPLHVAISNNHDDVVVALLKHEAVDADLCASLQEYNDTGYTSAYGSYNSVSNVTPLHVAMVSKLKKPTLEALLERSPESHKVADSDGRTPLLVAIGVADGEDNALLLMDNVERLEFNVRDDYQLNSPLHFACAKGKKAVALKLISLAGSPRDIDHIEEYRERDIYDGDYAKFAELSTVVRLNTIKYRVLENVFARVTKPGSEEIVPAGEEPKFQCYIHLDSKNTNGYTPLYLAMESRMTEVAVKLIERGADVDRLIEYNTNTYLQFAIRLAVPGDTPDMEKVARAIIDDTRRSRWRVSFTLSRQDHYKDTALHTALARRNADLSLKIIEKALELGLPELLSTRGDYERTPLHIAIGSAELVDVSARLIQILPLDDLNAEDSSMKTPIVEALDKLSEGDVQKRLLDMFIKKDVDMRAGNRSPLVIAIERKNETAIEMLLKSASGVSVKTGDEQSILHMAFEKKLSHKIMLRLIDSCVDEKATLTQTYNGDTILHRGMRDIKRAMLDEDTRLLDELRVLAKVLVGRGMADLCRCASETDGNTALHLAADAGDTRTAELILFQTDERGAVNYKLETPLHLAAAGGKRAIVVALLNTAGSKNTAEVEAAVRTLVNAQDHNMRTALHLAVTAEPLDKTIVQLIVSAGADLSCQDVTGAVPGMLCRDTEWKAILLEMAQHLPRAPYRVEPGELWAVGPNNFHSLGPLGNSDRVGGAGGRGASAVRRSGRNAAAGKKGVYVSEADGGVFVRPALREFFRSKTVVDIAAGNGYSAFVTASGELYTCGACKEGVLGHGDTESSYVTSPRLITSLENVRIARVACGDNHTVALTTDGGVYTFGSGGKGALGHGDANDRRRPTKVRALEGIRIVDIGVGTDHTVAVADSGHVFTFGSNEVGQLGLGEDAASRTESASEDLGNVVLVPTLVSALAAARVHVIKVACGDHHTALISRRGRLYMCGGGDAPEKMGLGENAARKVADFRKVNIGPGVSAAAGGSANSGSKVVDVACGPRHSIALLQDGSVYSTGTGSYGRLGLGTDETRNVFTLVTKGLPKAGRRTASDRIAAVAAGFRVSFAISQAGTVYMCGHNTNYHLGDNSITNEVYTFVENKTLGGARSSDSGGGSTALRADVVAASVSDTHSMFVTEEGRVYGCGCSYNYELGQYASLTVPVVVRSLAIGRPVAAASGVGHTLVVTEFGEVYASGYNKHYCCGVDDQSWVYVQPKKVDIPQSERVVSVACGDYFSAALTVGGDVYVWGENRYGQCGSRSYYADPVSYPRKLSGLPDRIIDIAAAGCRMIMTGQPRGRTAAAPGANATSTTLWGIGLGEHGQLGIPNSRLYTTNEGIHYTDMPQPIEDETLKTLIIESVAVGPFHTAVVASSQLWVFGSNKFGALGIERTRTGGGGGGGSGAAVGGAAGDDDGDSDFIDYPRQVQTEDAVKVMAVACGISHTAILTDKGVVYSAGSDCSLPLLDKAETTPWPKPDESVTIKYGDDIKLSTVKRLHTHDCCGPAESEAGGGGGGGGGGDRAVDTYNDDAGDNEGDDEGDSGSRAQEDSRVGFAKLSGQREPIYEVGAGWNFTITVTYTGSLDKYGSGLGDGDPNAAFKTGAVEEDGEQGGGGNSKKETKDADDTGGTSAKEEAVAGTLLTDRIRQSGSRIARLATGPCSLQIVTDGLGLVGSATVGLARRRGTPADFSKESYIPPAIVIYNLPSFTLKHELYNHLEARFGAIEYLSLQGAGGSVAIVGFKTAPSELRRDDLWAEPARLTVNGDIASLVHVRTLPACANVHPDGSPCTNSSSPAWYNWRSEDDCPFTTGPLLKAALAPRGAMLSQFVCLECAVERGQTKDSAFWDRDECVQICRYVVDGYLRDCKSLGTKFTDPEFPPTLASVTGRPTGSDSFFGGLGGPSYEPVRNDALLPDSWRRASEMFDHVPNPQLTVGGVSALDIRKGALNSSQLLAALAMVAERTGLIEDMFAAAEVETGIYAVLFAIADDDVDGDESEGGRESESGGGGGGGSKGKGAAGSSGGAGNDGGEQGEEQVKRRKWRFIIVDDWLPCRVPGGKRANSDMDEALPFFATATDPNELYVSVIEKAYAKSLSSYAAIEETCANKWNTIQEVSGGDFEEIVLTADGESGSIASDVVEETIRDLNAGTFWERLLELNMSGRIISCYIEDEANAGSVTDFGLIRHQPYAVTGCTVVGANRLVQIRNPLIREDGVGSWTGAWHNLKRDILGSKVDHSQFYMNYVDFANQGISNVATWNRVAITSLPRRPLKPAERSAAKYEARWGPVDINAAIAYTVKVEEQGTRVVVEVEQLEEEIEAVSLVVCAWRTNEMEFIEPDRRRGTPGFLCGDLRMATVIDRIERTTERTAWLELFLWPQPGHIYAILPSAYSVGAVKCDVRVFADEEIEAEQVGVMPSMWESDDEEEEEDESVSDDDEAAVLAAPVPLGLKSEKEKAAWKREQAAQYQLAQLERAKASSRRTDVRKAFRNRVRKRRGRNPAVRRRGRNQAVRRRNKKDVPRDDGEVGYEDIVEEQKTEMSQIALELAEIMGEIKAHGSSDEQLLLDEYATIRSDMAIVKEVANLYSEEQRVLAERRALEAAKAEFEAEKRRFESARSSPLPPVQGGSGSDTPRSAARLAQQRAAADAAIAEVNLLRNQVRQVKMTQVAAMAGGYGPAGSPQQFQQQQPPQQFQPQQPQQQQQMTSGGYARPGNLPAGLPTPPGFRSAPPAMHPAPPGMARGPGVPYSAAGVGVGAGPGAGAGAGARGNRGGRRGSGAAGSAGKGSPALEGYFEKGVYNSEPRPASSVRGRGSPQQRAPVLPPVAAWATPPPASSTLSSSYASSPGQPQRGGRGGGGIPMPRPQ